MIDDFDDPYEPTKDELEELYKILKKEEEEHKINKICKNRIFYDYKTQSHFEGWLKIHGIRW